MPSGLDIAWFASSLVSAYWNGAATYYRGIVRALHERGHRVSFYEPDAYERQQHRDIADPDWARVVVYPGEGLDGIARALEEARKADLLIKGSGIGVFDQWLEQAVLESKRPGAMVVFWDVDAPATLDRVHSNPDDPFRALIPQYDIIFTYGGGDPVISAYKKLGARDCIPIYNALDPTTHFPAAAEPRFRKDLAFLGNRLPDREARVEEFFLKPAAASPQFSYLLGGNGWAGKPMSTNVQYVGHLYTRDHNAFNSSPRLVLNINRESMARYGFSPATRVFEAAGAGACIISDCWIGIEYFFEPDKEIFIARTGDEVLEYVRKINDRRAHAVGEAAYHRVMAQHTYGHRAAQLEEVLCSARPAQQEKVL